MIRLKYLVYSILSPFYSLAAFFIKKRTIKPKEILIIKLDAIGDYLLFRNFIEVLKADSRFKDYNITICGNVAYKSLAEPLDSGLVHKFIWIDRKKYIFNLKYRFLKMKEITTQGYEIVIQPTFSRDYYFEDLLISVVSAEKKIGIESNLTNMTYKKRGQGNRYYTLLIKTSEQVVFEFQRNKEFFEKLLGRKIELSSPIIDPTSFRSNLDLPSKYLIFFIGSSKEFRQWPISHFVELGKYILGKYRGSIVICGGPADVPNSIELEQGLKTLRAINLVGKTRLVDLIPIISKSDLMISNETSAPHMAIALNVPVVVLSNGNNFGRFTPYPLDVTNKYFPVYHSKINQSKYQEMVASYSDGSDLKIGEIRVEEVIATLESKAQEWIS